MDRLAELSIDSLNLPSASAAVRLPEADKMRFAYETGAPALSTTTP